MSLLQQPIKMSAAINFNVSLRELRETDPELADLMHNNNNFSNLGFGIKNTPMATSIINLSIGTILVLIGVVGAIGNGIVIYILTRYKKLRISSGPMILSLATSDFFVSILHIMPAYSSFYQVWKFGAIGCEIYAASVGLGGFVSLLSLAAIAADRYSIIFGRHFVWITTKKTCYLIWFLSFLIILPPFFGWSKYTLEGMGTSCTWDYLDHSISNRLYYIFLLFFGFCVPVTIITYSYIGILRVVCYHSNIMKIFRTNNETLVAVGNRVNDSELAAAKVVFTLIICFLISWTPYAIISLIGQFGPSHFLSKLTTSLPAICAKSSVIYNPIIYGLSHPTFRQILRKLFFPNRTDNESLGKARRRSYPPQIGGGGKESLKNLNNNTTELTKFSTHNHKAPIIIGKLKRHRNSDDSAGGGLGYENPKVQLPGIPESRNSIEILQNKANKRAIEKPRKFNVIEPISIMDSSEAQSKENESNYLGQTPEQTNRETLQVHLESTFKNFSESDLNQRSFDDRFIKEVNLISLREYRHKRLNLIWKTFFRSENCLVEEYLSRKPKEYRLCRKQYQTNKDLRIKIAKSDSAESEQFDTPIGGSPLHEDTIEEILDRNKKEVQSEAKNHFDSCPILLDQNSSVVDYSGRPGSEGGESDHNNYDTVWLQNETTPQIPVGRKSCRENPINNLSLSQTTKNLQNSTTRASTSTSSKKLQIYIDEKNSNQQQYQRSMSAYDDTYSRFRTDSKKSSFGSATNSQSSKNQWKYNIHSRDCCECSFRLSSSCPPQSQNRYYYSSTAYKF